MFQNLKAAARYMGRAWKAHPTVAVYRDYFASRKARKS